MEQALLLLEDMVNLRLMRKHEVFLSLKRDLALVSSLIAFSHSLFFFFFNIYSYLPLFSLTFVFLF